MKTLNTQSLVLRSLSHLALTTATLSANSRCAYIYHNLQKPDELKQLKKIK